MLVRIAISLALLAGALSGCGEIPGRRQDGASPPASSLAGAQVQKDKFCVPRPSSTDIPEVTYQGRAGSGTRTFRELRDSIDSSCKNCHQAPANSGGFTYISELLGKTVSINGEMKFFPGISDVAERMADAINSEKMPPSSIRKNNPEGFARVGADLSAWIKTGKPDGEFKVGDGPGSSHSSMSLKPTTDLGECTPLPELVGTDFQKDRYFASLEKLPENLYETDLFTLDSYDLAQKGTVAYNVEYPLWADNSSKGRWIHVPAKIGLFRRLVKQAVHYDSQTKKLLIPENTRFYKTFYKPLVGKDGKKRYSRVETRIIVVRYPSEKSLFGTYLWNESQQSAMLVQTPYRDGTPWKDNIFQVLIDEKTGKTRKYALPAKHRCIQCHQGSETQSFILGFTPLQINRRDLGEAGRQVPITAEEKSQVSRLLKYGVIDGFENAEQLQKIEWEGEKRPRNIYDVRAQGYLLGNCAHCHNPDGFAMKQNGVQLNLSAGQIYDFNTHLRSIHFPVTQERRFVDAQGDLEKSYLYTKLSASPSEQGLFAQMPLHTPGSPDCRGLELVGKWIKTWESIDAAEKFQPECKTQEDFPWVDQDFTWPESESYVPRRQDWATAMPDSIKNLEFSDELKALSRKQYPVGYWIKKPECKFPDVKPLPEQIKPWMVNSSGQLKRPFGEVYTSRPGAWYFTTTCAKCHGPQGDGNSTFALALLNWSGGSVRVANLMKGLFGNGGDHLKTFDVSMPNGKPKNLGGNYLLWMATDGTRVQFPPEAANYLGKHKAQMLNSFREKCMSYIPSSQQVAKPFFQDYEIFKDICTYNNKDVTDPQIQFDPATGDPVNPAALERWMDQAAINSGWAIFDYLTTAAKGDWWPANDACEKVHGP